MKTFAVYERKVTRTLSLPRSAKFHSKKFRKIYFTPRVLTRCSKEQTRVSVYVRYCRRYRRASISRKYTRRSRARRLRELFLLLALTLHLHASFITLPPLPSRLSYLLDKYRVVCMLIGPERVHDILAALLTIHIASATPITIFVKCVMDACAIHVRIVRRDYVMDVVGKCVI